MQTDGGFYMKIFSCIIMDSSKPDQRNSKNRQDLWDRKLERTSTTVNRRAVREENHRIKRKVGKEELIVDKLWPIAHHLYSENNI